MKKLHTKDINVLKYYVNQFLKSDNKTELLLTYNKLNSLNSDSPKENISEENTDLICQYHTSQMLEERIPQTRVTKGYRIPAHDVISIFVLARMLAGSSDEKKKKTRLRK